MRKWVVRGGLFCNNMGEFEKFIFCLFYGFKWL
jgi:hypothetical protein